MVNGEGEAGSEEKARLEAQAFTCEERRLREHLERPFMPEKAAPSTWGIALSGGGSKASAFAIGVLAGLSDHGLLDKADFISSVSGGGYAAYFYYAHRLFPHVRAGTRPLAGNDDLYRDCVALESGLVSKEVKEQIVQVNHCERLQLGSKAEKPEFKQQDIRYQAYLKCSQDMLRPGACNMDTTVNWKKGISLASIGGTILTFIPSWVPNAIFDWGWSTSPSARSYKDGIGLGFGATMANPDPYRASTYQSRTRHCGTDSSPGDAVHDCRPNMFDPDPVPMTFDELRTGLLKMRGQDGKGLPFWIMNAAAPKNRTSAAWLTRGREDITNSDMFEMTAVSHGSGRYGYVSASPAIHDMSVLDAVAASAAFMDGAQLVYKSPLVRTLAGLGLNATNADWGLDIANYNVSTQRRTTYRFLPFPLYYLDGTSATTPERKDRERSVFIRLIDGGNAENLGVYSLLKRGVRNVVISDAAQDAHGTLADICGLRQRLLNTPDRVLPRHLYVPGLKEFVSHCESYQTAKWAYNIYGWNYTYPVMLGCIRKNSSSDPNAESCEGLGDDEIRLFIVKPAINVSHFVEMQLDKRPGIRQVSACMVRGLPNQDPSLINCDSATFLRANDGIKSGRCPLFPQHSTVFVTANSSGTIFTAYRELARQYVATVTPMIRDITQGQRSGIAEFERVAREQLRVPVQRSGNVCRPFYESTSPS
ncbi:hypothetical protein CR152_21295 [Massilia violaceinigra]|uniref:PNPLA domain-containing protein n=1 Tax=Massilia violaceinigra TaxID=2045208 RepID=A0A2D2DP72_9BURK|nr:hypothetical protein CR152_21295 [Massilia violaceinigra]